MMVVGREFNISEVGKMIGILFFRVIFWTVEVVKAVLCFIIILFIDMLFYYK